MTFQPQRSRASLQFSRRRLTLIVAGAIAFGCIPTAIGMLVWHNALREQAAIDAANAAVDLGQILTDEYQSKISDYEAKQQDYESRIGTCTDDVSQLQSLVSAMDKKSNDDYQSTVDFFTQYNYNAGDAVALFTAL